MWRLKVRAYNSRLDSYLQIRDVKKWTNHPSSTDLAESVSLAQRHATTPEKRKAKEQAALAAARDSRIPSNAAIVDMLKSIKTEW